MVYIEKIKKMLYINHEVMYMPKRNVYELDNNKKVYTSTELRALGYAQYAITKMLALGMIEKISSSVYENVNYNGPDSDFYYVSPLIAGGVVCMLSAAVYYNLSSYWPNEIDVAVKKDKKIATLPDFPNMNIYHFGGDRYDMGIEQINENGNTFFIYDIEKTVIDILYFRNQVGIEETKEILTKYLKKSDRNLVKLHKYAEKLNCEKILRTYLEVLV